MDNKHAHQMLEAFCQDCCKNGVQALCPGGDYCEVHDHLLQELTKINPYEEDEKSIPPHQLLADAYCKVVCEVYTCSDRNGSERSVCPNYTQRLEMYGKIPSLFLSDLNVLPAPTRRIGPQYEYRTFQWSGGSGYMDHLNGNGKEGWKVSCVLHRDRSNAFLLLYRQL